MTVFAHDCVEVRPCGAIKAVAGDQSQRVFRQVTR